MTALECLDVTLGLPRRIMMNVQGSGVIERKEALLAALQKCGAERKEVRRFNARQ